MTRARRRNGADIARIETFYCRYGQHHVAPLDLENAPANQGVCLECAFQIYDMLAKVVFVPELTPAARVKAWKSWHELRATTQLKERFRQGSDEPGWVYYIAQDDLIKIGYAKDVTQRMKAYGPTARLLAVHPGTQNLEKEMHAKFRDCLDSGREWFRQADHLMEHIEGVRERFGDPAIFEYQYTKPKTQEEKVRAMFATREFPSVADGAHSTR